jgi:hypothetical protein
MKKVVVFDSNCLYKISLKVIIYVCYIFKVMIFTEVHFVCLFTLCATLVGKEVLQLFGWPTTE